MTLYFDHNATAPLSSTARKTWLRMQKEAWHNPSAPYRPAARARALLEDYRERLARLIDLDDPRRLIFTSGATESTNAIIAYLERHYSGSTPKKTVAAPPGEHASVNECLKHLWGGTVVQLPVDGDGVVVLKALRDLLIRNRYRSETLVTIMAANNETGVLQPWREAAEACRRAGVAFHCDAAQWLGRLDPRDLGTCDWLTGSAHKSGGPKGVGFLVRARGAESFVATHGGGQEYGYRSGTEDLPSIAAMVEHLEETNRRSQMRRSPERGRDLFESILTQHLPGVRFPGAGAARLWNTSSVLLPRHDRIRWLNALEKAGILAAAGSACSSSKGSAERSHVLLAIGIRAVEAERVLRFSSGPSTTHAHWKQAAETILSVLADLDSRQAGDVIDIPPQPAPSSARGT